MAALANTITSLYNRIFPQTDPGPGMVTLRRKQAEMARALVNVHKSHSFHFLDLPPKIRTRIYTFIFAANVVTVCSYNKDKSSGTFSIDERCQILMTNKQVYKEAHTFYYWHSDWKFVKVSSLNYIAWGDGGLSKLRLVQKVIITHQDVLTIFANYLRFFLNLKVMVIDFPLQIHLKEPYEPQDDARLTRKVRTGEWWRQRVVPFLPLMTERKFYLKIGVLAIYDKSPDNQEVWSALDCVFI